MTRAPGAPTCTEITEASRPQGGLSRSRLAVRRQESHSRLSGLHLRIAQGAGDPRAGFLSVCECARPVEACVGDEDTLTPARDARPASSCGPVRCRTNLLAKSTSFSLDARDLGDREAQK